MLITRAANVGEHQPVSVVCREIGVVPSAGPGIHSTATLYFPSNSSLKVSTSYVGKQSSPKYDIIVATMPDRIAANRRFLSNIFLQGPFEGHGFIAKPPSTPIHKLPHYDFTLSDRPVDEWVPWIVDNYEREVRAHEALDDDSVPTAKLPTGTHIYAAAFGAPVHAYIDNNPCALPLAMNAEEADKIEEPDIFGVPVLARIFELGEKVRRQIGKDAYLGQPDMQTGFDTAALLWDKTDFYCSLIDPTTQASVKRLVNKCARTFKKFITAYRKEFSRATPMHCPGTWAPPEMGPWASNDECGAISTELFEKLCLPEMVDLSQTFDGFGMHCCAAAEHQFESFKKIPNFYGFNRVAAAGRGYGTLLEHFNGPENPVHVLAWVPEDDIRMLIENAAGGTRFIFVLMGAEEEDAKVWLENMRRLSPRLSV